MNYQSIKDQSIIFDYLIKGNPDPRFWKITYSGSPEPKYRVVFFEQDKSYGFEFWMCREIGKSGGVLSYCIWSFKKFNFIDDTYKTEEVEDPWVYISNLIKIIIRENSLNKIL